MARLLAKVHTCVYNMHMAKQQRLRATELQRVFKSQGRKLQWLAGRAGLSEPFTSRVIRGERTVSQEKAQRIADALGTPLFLIFECTYVHQIGTIGEDTAA